METVLSPEGKIIKERTTDKKRLENNLLEGLEICINKIAKMKRHDDIKKYLFFGNSQELNIKEEIARLLLIATANPTNISPIDDISEKLIDSHITDIDSLFIKEFLSMEARNNASSFVHSDFYLQISKKVEEMEIKKMMNDKYYLNDSMFLMKNLMNLYMANIDNNVKNHNIDVRYREPLAELFQYNLDITEGKIKNGVINNVSI